MAMPDPLLTSSFSSSECQYQVFVSFRGTDTRNNFTLNLRNSLARNGIDAFTDSKLLAGEDISTLFQRIEGSIMSIVVFSEHYADSFWCLDELATIIKCKEENGHQVIPIFYKVKKSDVKEQKGSFGAPFLKPEESFKEHAHKVEKWKNALRIASDISGFVLPGDMTEIQVLENVAQNIFRILNKFSPYEICGLPGIESRSKELEELLMFDNASCVRIIGVHGMHGIGKTKVAQSVYKRNYHLFNGHHFVEDIDKEWKQHSLLQLRKDLFSRLLDMDMDSVDIRANRGLEDCLRNKRVFIVLDNVTNRKQIQDLIGDKPFKNSFRGGSRIVITTRDKKVLENIADATYVVPKLNDMEAMELFRLKAFPDDDSLPEEYVDLSKKFVYYSKGHPSALKYLGGDLCGKEKELWTKKWEGLQKWPHKEIRDELKTSYDELDENQKRIFLDIACFFRSEKADFVKNILKSARFDAEDVMEELEAKCMVTISYNRIEMHDLLHQMGKDIGFESSVRRVGKRSRLWELIDVRQILEQKLGSEYVRGIFLNMSDVERIKLSPAAFEKMTNLEFLKFHNSHCSQWCDKDHKGLDRFSDKLVYLHWQGYPYDYLPSEFHPEELVDLYLRYSHIKQLWEDEKNTKNLRWVDLSHSKDLLNLSGLSRAVNLERLELEGCTSLVLLGPSIEQMNKLIYLNLRECTSLESLPEGINLKSLKTLILSGCSKLKEFHIISENIESLDLQGTAIEQVESIERLRNLILLNLKNCLKLKT